MGLEQYLQAVLWARGAGLGLWGCRGVREALRGTRVITLAATWYMGILHKIPLAERFPKLVHKIWVLVGR